MSIEKMNRRTFMLGALSGIFLLATTGKSEAQDDDFVWHKENFMLWQDSVADLLRKLYDKGLLDHNLALKHKDIDYQLSLALINLKEKECNPNFIEQIDKFLNSLKQIQENLPGYGRYFKYKHRSADKWFTLFQYTFIFYKEYFAQSYCE